MRITDVLGYYITWLALNFLLLANNLDTSSARRGTRLHYVHMLVIFCFSIHAEFTIVIGEQVSFWAEIELREDSAHSTDVLPHHILSADLE